MKATLVSRRSREALDQRAQAEAFVQPRAGAAREQEPSIGGYRGSPELDADLRIEREVNLARCRVTHWVVPCASARSPREPRFLGGLSDYGHRARLLVVLILLAGVAAGCAYRLHAPMQPDGWSAQPIAVVRRFAPDADLDPTTGTPVGDEGYFLYILTEAANWDFRDATSLLLSILQRPWAHGWIILGSFRHHMEFGHTGDFGLEKPRYHEGVMQRVRDGDRNPIAYLWQTMSDGQFQIGKPNRPPTFVWRMPITRRRYQLIYEHVMQRKYDQFGVRTNNCTDMVVETAALAGINLSHRIRLTLPPEVKVWGRTLRVWTDPQYRVLEFGTPEVLEADLRQLAQVGIGSDATEWYLALKH